jgi:hypothetical protein
MRWGVAAGCLAVVVAVAPVSARASEPASDPDTGRVVSGVFLGLLVGGLAGAAGGYAGHAIASDPDCDSCNSELIPTIIGAQVGLNLGLAAGVTVAGNHDGGKGSFVVSLAAGATFSALSWLLLPDGDSLDLYEGGFVGFLLPIPATMIGYWATHDHTELKVVPTGNGLAVMGRF